MKRLNPGQCHIEVLSLSDHQKNKTIDVGNGILEFIHSVDIYESIFSFHIIADIHFIDGASIRERFNLTGNELLKIKFSGYGNEDSLEYTLYSAELMGIVPESNLRSKMFTVRFVSRELIQNSSIVVAKSYATSAGEMIQDLLTTSLKSTKKLNRDPSKDQPVTVIPHLKPFEAVDLVRRRAVSTSFKSPFLFFENKNGYYFKTIESLIKDRSIMNGRYEDLVFFQNEAISSNIKGTSTSITDTSSHLLFSNYTVNNSFNVLHLLDNNGVNGVVQQFDFVTKKFQERTFINDDSFENLTNKKNPIASSGIISEYGQNRNRPSLIPFSKYKDTNNSTVNFLYDNVLERACFANIITQQKTYVDVPGNTKVLAGSVIKLNVPLYDSLQVRNLNSVDSGSYLVSSVKHSISVAEDTKYTTHMELMRNGRGVFEQ